MADEKVIIPIDLTVTDIRTGDIDLRDVEKSITSRMSGIAKSVGDVLGNVDTSKLNKSLASSMDKVTSSYQKLSIAQSKLNEALNTAGSSSPKFKKELQAIQSEIEVTERSWESLADLLLESPVLQSGLNKRDMGLPLSKSEADSVRMFEEAADRYEEKLAELKSKMPDPKNFISSATTTELQKLVNVYYEVFNAAKKVEAANAEWTKSLKDNKASDEYLKMASEIQKAEQKLASLQEKAAKMQALGATDKQWESLVYEAQQLEKSITANEEKMRKLVSTGQAFRFGNGGSSIGQEYMKLTGVISRVEKGMKAINSMKPGTMYTDEYSKQLKTLEALERKLMSYNDKFNKMRATGASDKQWKSLSADATILEGKIKSITENLVEMVKNGSAFKLGTGDADAELESLANRLSESESSLGKLKNSATGVNQTFLGLVKGLSKFGAAAKSKIGSVISMFKKLRKSSESTSKSVSKSLKHMWRDLLMFAVGVRSAFFLVRKLRNVFINTFKEMSLQIPEINDQISSFLTSLNQLKGSVGTAFQPLVSVAIPAINALTAALSNAMNTLGMFFATLTGQGYIYKFTAGQVDYAESLEDTAGSAKEAQKSLMGFDEINRLNGDTGGGAGSGDVPTGTWEKEIIEGTSSLAELLKKAWSESDFTEVGNYIGEKLLGALTTANDWITGKGFAYAEKIGKSLGTLLNGVFEIDGLGDQLGTTIANAINMALRGINKFLTTTNWTDIGQFLYEWVNSSIKTVDWNLLGETLGNILRAAIDIAWTFITGIDFETLGNNISTALNGMLSKLGQIDDTGLSGWAKLGQTISGAISGILDTLITALQGLNWDSVGQAIGDLISNIDWAGLTWNFIKLKAAIISGMAEAFMNWTATEPVSAGIAALIFTACAGVKIVSIVKAVKPIASGIVEVLALAIGGAGTLKEAMIAVFGKGTQLFSGIGAVVSGAIMAFTNFFSMLQNGFSWFKEILMIIGTAIAAVGAVILGVPATVAAAVAGIVAAVATLVVLVVQYWDEICAFFVAAWEWLKGIFSAALTFISDLWNTVWTAISTFFINLWNNIVESVTNAIDNVSQVITNVVTAISTWWTNTWTSIKNTFSNIWNSITAVVSDKINGIKNRLTSVLTGIKAVWNNAWTTMKNTVTGIFNGIWTAIKNVINSIIGGINGLIRGVVGGMNAVVNAINTLSFEVPDWVPGFGGSTFGFNIPNITAPQIPLLAQGAVIPPNKEFMAILGDQKHGTNIEAPLDTIKQAVAEELAEYIDAMMTGFQAVVEAVNNKDLDVRIGDNAIGKAAERYNKRQALVRGTI